MTPQERDFLMSLQADPRWESLLKSIEIRQPKFKPGESFEEHVYVSGRYYENDRILAILKLKGDLK